MYCGETNSYRLNKYRKGKYKMIKNIKYILCSEEIYNIYSACMFEPTFDKFKLKTEQMQKDSSVSVYGYF